MKDKEKELEGYKNALIKKDERIKNLQDYIKVLKENKKESWEIVLEFLKNSCKSFEQAFNTYNNTVNIHIDILTSIETLEKPDKNNIISKGILRMVLSKKSLITEEANTYILFNFVFGFRSLEEINSSHWRNELFNKLLQGFMDNNYKVFESLLKMKKDKKNDKII